MFISFCMYLIVKVFVFFLSSRQWGQIRVNPLFQTPCGCSPPCCHQSQLDGHSCPLSFIITHEHTCSQVREPVRGAGAEVGKPPLFRDDKHLCKPSKQLLSFSLSLSKLTPTAARTAVCLTPPKTSIQASMRDESKREIHHCRKSGLIKALRASSKYNHWDGGSSSPPLFTWAEKVEIAVRRKDNYFAGH